MSLIQFGHPKCIFLIIIVAITQTIEQIIISQNFEYINPLFYLFLMFIGEFLSIFFYLYQICNKSIDINNQFINKYSLFFIFAIFICSLSDFLSSFNYFIFFDFDF